LGESGGGGQVTLGDYTSSVSGADFNLSFAYGSKQKPQLLASPGNSIAVLGNYYPSSHIAQALGLNNSIGNNLVFGLQNAQLNWIGGFGDMGTVSPGPPGTRAYVGLSIGGSSGNHYGWADIEYTASQQLTLYGFAVETDLNTPILAGAGAVPEPKETALVMALLAGSAALYRRRQLAKSH
jgi:hypothetical protein